MGFRVVVFVCLFFQAGRQTDTGCVRACVRVRERELNKPGPGRHPLNANNTVADQLAQQSRLVSP